MATTEPLFLAIDVGTTGARAAAINQEGHRVAEVRRPYATTTPHPGWAEQDADAWGTQALDAVRALPKRVAGRIAAIGLTGQSPSVAPVDHRGRPIGAGLIYKDNRAVHEAAEMIRRVGAAAFHERTGHTPTAFHVGAKVLWLREHQPLVFQKTAKFLQPRDVVLHRLCGEMLTDETHANSTLFFDLQKRTWDDELFETFDLDRGLFPAAVPSASVVASLSRTRAGELGLLAGIPIVIGAGDSQCVAFGVGVTEKGAISEMAGSSSCLNSVVQVPRKDLRITHYSHVIPGCFTTELGLNTTGAALQWASDQLGFSDIEAFERAASRFYGRLRRGGPQGDARALAPLFLPYLGDGERDDPTMRAGFVGLSDRHDRSALAYAVVEGVAMAVAEMIDVLRRAGSPLDELRVSGGAARVDLLGQIKADLLEATVLHLSTDASATGAALLAAKSAGFSEATRNATTRILTEAKRFSPNPRLAEMLGVRRAWFNRVRRGAAMHLDGMPVGDEELK